MKLSKNYKIVAVSNLVIVVLVILLDQFSKLYLTNAVGLGNTKEFLPGIVQIALVQNTGGAFSIFKNFPVVFKIIGLVNVFAFSYVAFCPTVVVNNVIRLGCGFILGGTIGNLIDRFLKGGVVDFINLQFFDFAIFNVADVCVDIGVLLIFLGLVLRRGK